jgi:exonuclease SbcC
MSVLSRLFGKKPQSETRATARTNKIASLDTLSPDALVGIALGDAKGDADDQLRLAAIQKLDDEKALLQIAFGPATTQMQRIAKQRLAALVDAGKLDFNQLTAEMADPLKLFAVMSYSQQSERLEQLLSSIDESEVLYKVASEGATVKLRQIAAEKITDRAQLQQLLKEAKGKDKTVYKIVKDKCDHFKEEEKTLAATQAVIDSVAQAIEQHSHRPFDFQFTAKFHLLQQQWSPLAPLAAEQIRQTTQQAIERCQAQINAIETAQAEAVARKIELASADENRHKILQALNSLAKQAVLAEQLDDTHSSLAELTAQWQSLDASKPATVKEQKAFTGLSEMIPVAQQQFERYGSLLAHISALVTLDSDDQQADEKPGIYRHLKQRLQVDSLFDEEDVLPQVVLDGRAAIEQWDKKRADKKAEHQHAQRQIGGLIRKAKEASNTGKLQQAAGLRRAIAEKIIQLNPIPAHLQSQLQQLDDILDKLQDWKDYAVLPKKHELIASMKALIGSAEHPEALAIKIKRLQDDWKSLSKGGGLHKDGQEQDQELWEDFHQSAQIAYQPCRDYFAEQAAIRQRNLESCKALVEQLKTYEQNYTWESADWKAVEKVVRLAHQEWRDYSPTDRAATQPVLAEFEAVLARIDQRLNDERNKNTAVKQSLIQRARQLLEQDDTRMAIEDVKQLQAQWQQVGIMARAIDQKLWREFRGVCDAIFAKKHQQTVEFKEELETNLANAEKLIADLRHLAGLSGQALIDGRKQVEELQQAFNNLGHLPKARMNDVKADFAQAVEQFEKQVKQERNLAKQQIWLNLFAANDILRLCQLSLREARDQATQESLKTETLDKVAMVGQFPGGGMKALQQKLESDVAMDDLAGNVVALRLLCIRAEILTGATTPAADQALRMDYQVKQLEQNFGQKPQDIRSEIDALVFEWLATGPVVTTEYSPLFERFYACWLKVFK